MGNARPFVVGLSAAVLAGAAYVVAGPLTPPPGPIAETDPSLADLAGLIQATGGDPLAFADTSSTPGSSTDGRPVSLGGLGAFSVRLSLDGLPAQDFAIADIGRVLQVIDQGTPGGEPLLTPGQAAYEVTLIRPLTSDLSYDALFDAFTAGTATALDGTIVFRDDQGTPVAEFGIKSCILSAIDVRNVGGEAVEQVQLICTEIQRIPVGP